MSTQFTRKPQHDVSPVYVSRSSSRVLSGVEIPDEVLFSSFEAARWAPSAKNSQPWHFIYSKRDSSTFSTFFNLLFERNQAWAGEASALLVLLSRTVQDSDDGLQRLRFHSFDTGAAWSSFAHQASQLGWSTRALGGFDRDAARRELSIPEEYEIEIMIAIGKPVNPSARSEEQQTTDQPTDRQPIEKFVSEGRFNIA